MIEQLLAHIGNLEEKFNESATTTNNVGDDTRKNFDCKYGLLIELKKFVLDSMLPYFIDRTVEGLKGHDKDNYLVQQERARLLNICSNNKDYLDINITMDYFDKEIQAKFKEVSKQREVQRKYLKKKG